MKRLAYIQSIAEREPWVWFIVRLSQYWNWALLATILLGATSALWQCDPLILKWLIDNVLPGHRANMIIFAAALILIVQCGRLLALAGSVYASAQCGQKLTAGLRREVFRNTGNIPAEAIEGARAGDIVYSLEQDIDSVMWLGSETLPSFIRISFAALFSIVMMWRLDVRLTLISCAIIPLSIALGWYSRNTLKRFAEQSRLAAVERSSFSSEMIAASVQIRILHAFSRICQLYEARVSDGVRATLAERRMQIVYAIMSLLIVVLASTLMLETGGMAVISKRLSIGSYVAFYTYLLRLFEPLNGAVELFSKMQRGVVSIARLQELTSAKSFDQQTTSFTKPTAKYLAAHHCESLACDILACSDLSFAYGSGNLAFRDVTFTIRRGDRLLIDGPTGAGKSTLLKAIAGVYHNYEGKLLIDEVDCRDCSVNRSALFGFISQHPVLFSGSLRENLMLGSPQATSAEIDDALFRSCTDSLVARLPGSLDYHISQSGNGLSGGERQRIALARTVLQKRPILLMDEALTGLDDETKTELLSRLRAYTTKRITILASHDHLCKLWASHRVSLSSRRGETSREPLSDLRITQ